MQELLDRLFKPFETLLVDAASSWPAARILDVGCGTGTTTLAIARRSSTKVHCVGVDISEPMLALARERSERESTPATFIHADAQTYSFESMSFDVILSRFGVMFFDDARQAFANLRRAAASDAELCFIAWRSAAENPFMTTAERAAAPFLPDLPVRRPDQPGQFAFADQDRVHALLEESGWSEIDIRPLDVECTMAEKDLVRYLTRLGPVGRVLQETDEPTRTQIVETVRDAFEHFVHGAEVRFTAACWMVHARARPASR
ncbi:MAG TPA: methyltransferase domain-containing protein [Gemmatimonadaceae bacterium]|nr:methyltransferase domain-containing protein [Gemmatimonadaceae bacterium]